MHNPGELTRTQQISDMYNQRLAHVNSLEQIRLVDSYSSSPKDVGPVHFPVVDPVRQEYLSSVNRELDAIDKNPEYNWLERQILKRAAKIKNSTEQAYINPYKVKQPFQQFTLNNSPYMNQFIDNWNLFKAKPEVDKTVPEVTETPEAAKTTPALSVKPKPTDWNKVAQQNGFENMEEVKEWQKILGVTVDGKWGKKSKAARQQYLALADKGWKQETAEDGSTYFIDPTTNERVWATGKREAGTPINDAPIIEEPVQTQIANSLATNMFITNPIQKNAYLFSMSIPEETQKQYAEQQRKKQEQQKANQNMQQNLNKLFGQGEYKTFNGIQYRRYDPVGPGDFWIDYNTGKVFNSSVGGGLGKQIDLTQRHPAPRIQQHYNTMTEAINKYKQYKQGGQVNKVKYFQQGGATQPSIEEQVISLVQAAMQGDQQATQQVEQILAKAQQGDPQAVKLAQLIQQALDSLKGQATRAKWGAKLGYIQHLKSGKKACPECGQPVEKKACGGKKAKKKYFGGWL